MPGSMTSTVLSRSIRTHEWVYLVMCADREGAEPVVMGSSRFCAAWVPAGSAISVEPHLRGVKSEPASDRRW